MKFVVALVSQENPMTNVKKVDCALIPPCAKTVYNKMQRAHFISILWGNADSAHPGHVLDPLNYGWKEKNGYYTPDWFLGPALPDYLFHEREREEDSIEDHQSYQPDVATVFENDDDSNSENIWSDDSESETEI